MVEDNGPPRPTGEGTTQRSGESGGRPRTRRSRPVPQSTGAPRPAAPAEPPVYASSADHGRPRHKKNRRNDRNGRPERGGQGQPQGQGQRHGEASRQGGRNDRRNNNRSRRVRPPGRENVEISRRVEGTFERHAETWWADRWLHVLNQFGWKNRIANGRLYAKDGRVGTFVVESGRIKAKVQGTRAEPYDVTIQLKPLPDSDWDLVVDIMSCQALFTAQLLAGDMPQDVEEVFDAAHAPLFPRTKDDLKAHCTCPDMVNPCKHIAAVYYVMAEAFDKDPFLIFHLRGRSREALLAMLRAQRAAEAQAGPLAIETLDAGSLETLRFWQAGDELEAVHIQIQVPSIPGANARRIGRPPFWRSPADPVTRLPEVYEAIARRAREVALNEPLIGAHAEV